MNFFRLWALTVKEAKQLLRDPYSIFLGILLPVVLLLVCGYGMSTDIRNIKLAIVVPEKSEFASKVVSKFDASEYFDVLIVSDTLSGERLVREHQADACLFLPQNFSRQQTTANAEVFIAVNASNPSLAYTKESYIKGVLASAAAQFAEESGVNTSVASSADSLLIDSSAAGSLSVDSSGNFGQGTGFFNVNSSVFNLNRNRWNQNSLTGSSLTGNGLGGAEPAGGSLSELSSFSSGNGGNIDLKSRLWFNDANVSAFTLIPGIIVIVMTMIGALLTSMVMAREYEKGNLESMFVTPMKSSEILLAKTLNNFVLGMIGLAVSLLVSHYLFHIPIRASWYVIPLGSAVFLIMSLCLGLLISSLTKNQFIAVELAAIITFLPSFLLSGFLFEIKSMPVFLQWITVFVPARYYVDFLQTAFLVGDVGPNILKNIGILALFAMVFMVLAKRKNPKHLEG